MSRSVLYTSSPLLASKTPVWRSKFIVAMIGLGFVGLGARAAYVQVLGNDFFQRQGEVRFARTLELPASATSGDRAAYRLRWGEVVIPGLWELEHVIVQRTWAVLLRYLQNDGQDGKEGEAQVCIWDGKELLPLDLPWPVARITPTPSARAPKSLRVRVLAMVGVVKESDADLRKPTWRWYQEPFTWERLEKTEYTPLYEVRDIVPDNQGVWRLLPSWRTIATTQHPCADGDYFWAGDVKDELWWFGGMRQYTPEQPQDDALVPRCHGLCGSAK